MTSFLMICRAVRSDRLLEATNEFVLKILGKKLLKFEEINFMKIVKNFQQILIISENGKKIVQPVIDNLQMRSY